MTQVWCGQIDILRHEGDLQQADQGRDGSAWPHKPGKPPLLILHFHLCWISCAEIECQYPESQ